MGTTMRAVGAFVRRDWIAARSYTLPFWLEVGGIVLSTAVMFYLSKLVNRAGFEVDGEPLGNYFGFVIVGLAVLGIVSGGTASISGRLRADQATGTLELLFAAPVRTSTVAIGSGAYDILQAALLALLQIATAVLMFGLDIEAGIVDVAVFFGGLLAVLGFATALGLAIAAFAVVYKNPGPVLGLVLNGVALVSGTYFPTGLLPQGLERIADVSPVAWANDVLRAAIGDQPVPTGDLIALVAVTAVMLPLAVRLFDLAVRRAKREGTLAQY